MLCKKIFAGVILLAAIVVGVASVLAAGGSNSGLIINLSILGHFATPALLVLAFGALIKYLFSCPASCNCPCCKPSCDKTAGQSCSK